MSTTKKRLTNFEDKKFKTANRDDSTSQTKSVISGKELALMLVAIAVCSTLLVLYYVYFGK